MRPTLVITLAMAIFVAAVTASKHKKTPCDVTAAPMVLSSAWTERVCKVECDCQQGNDETCSMCGFGSGCNA
ncbi:hypothetical protein E8E12_011491 [Didymella heteroderae]|uniref:Uncharacterized protein n=1 Tax=Didymella heteroderae TaxID=1769908 RepID=A0A9P4X0F2_9PLEO|nr:hypothetical protein E8E12_011491 [Didymella heteroderae]